MATLGLSMKFYLGTKYPNWMREEEFRDVPMFISHRTLLKYKKLHPSLTEWCLDSGGFSELTLYNEWRTTPGEYIKAIRRYQDEIGKLNWAAPQDWMCEPFMNEKTGKSVEEHQKLTVENYLELKHRADDLPIIPVIQGWSLDDYLRCVDMFIQAGIDLEKYETVGIGSVCRRQGTGEAENIVYRLKPLRLHGFGMKTTAVHRFGYLLASSDSMAWSFSGRMRPDPECPKKQCTDCRHYALSWRDNILNPKFPNLFHQLEAEC